MHSTTLLLSPVIPGILEDLADGDKVDTVAESALQEARESGHEENVVDGSDAWMNFGMTNSIEMYPQVPKSVDADDISCLASSPPRTLLSGARARR